MIIDAILFPVFVLGIVALGALFLSIGSRILRSHDQPLHDDLPTIGFLGLVFLGFLGVLANFFVGLASPGFIALILCCLLIGLTILWTRRGRIDRLQLAYLAATALLFSPMASVLEAGYDGGLYHLPHQLWLRTDKVVLGLANFHGRFAFGSLYEYMSAPLWIGGDLRALSYVLLAFLVFFICFVANKARSGSGAIPLLTIGILINIIAYRGYMNLVYTNTDIPSGLLFAAAFTYGFELTFTKQPVGRSEIFILFMLSLGAFMLKPSAVTLTLWIAFVVAFLLIHKATTIKDIAAAASIPAVISTIWLLRSVLLSGCLLFPEKASCLNLPWGADGVAEAYKNAITAWARHPATGLYSLQSSAWFADWWLPYYQDFLKGLAKAGGWVAAAYISCIFLSKFKSNRLFDPRIFAGVLFGFFGAAFWFWIAPDPRFGVGIFIILLPVTLLLLPVYPPNQNVMRGLAIALSLILSLQCSWSAWGLFFHRPLIFEALTVVTPETMPDSHFGVRPVTGDQCWLVPDCAPYARPPISSLHGYKAFLSQNPSQR